MMPPLWLELHAGLWRALMAPWLATRPSAAPKRQPQEPEPRPEPERPALRIVKSEGKP